MTVESDSYERLHDIAGTLSEISRKEAHNVYELFDWPDELDTDLYWMAPELMTPYSTTMWDEIDEASRRRLSHLEAVNFFSLNVHLIRELIGEVADRIYSTRFPGLSDFFHDFLREENEHMWFFATFAQRYGDGVLPGDRMSSADTSEDPAVRDLTVFGRILIAEELCDAFNAAMANDTRLPEVVQAINRVHHQDESRHIAFGRQMLRALADEARRSSGSEGVRVAGEYLARYLSVCLRSFYNRKIYLDAELPNAAGLRSKLVADPARHDVHRRLMAKTTTFMDRIGLFGADDVRW